MEILSASLETILAILATLPLVAVIICALRRAARNVNQILSDELEPAIEPEPAGELAPDHPPARRGTTVEVP